MNIILILILIGILVILSAGYITMKVNKLDFSFLNKKNKQKFKIFFILYLCSAIISILLYFTRTDSYIRPLGYFICLSFMCTFIMTEIIYSPNQLKYRCFILFQIIMTSLLFILTQALMYPTVLGYDPWEHKALTEEIIRLSRLPQTIGIEGLAYTKMPGMHLVVATSSLITNQKYEITSLISVGFPALILNVLFVYLIGKKAFNSKTGLISALLISIADNNLDMIGKNIIPNTIGVAIILAMLFILLYRLYYKFNLKYFIILIIFSIFLMITHALSYGFLLLSVFLIIISSVFFIGFTNFQLIKLKTPLKQKRYLKTLLFFFTFFILLVFPYWAFIAKIPIIQIEGILNRLFKSGSISTSYYISDLRVSFTDVLLARAGMILYFAIAIIGILWVLLRIKNYKHFSIGCLSAFLIVTSGTTFLMFAFKGIEHRFWYYGEVINGIMVAIAIILIYKNFYKREYIKKIVPYIMIFIISFLFITSGMANNDNPLIKSYSVRTGLIMSEFQATKFVDSVGEVNYERIPFFRVWYKEKYASVRANNRIELKKFNHIAVTVAPNGLTKIYINGILGGSNNIPMPLPDSLSKNLIIGGFNRDDLWYFNGTIKYIRIYNRSLSDVEIKQNFIGDVTTVGIVSWWKFDEGYGNVTHDIVGVNDGKIYGGNWSAYHKENVLSFDGMDDYVNCGNDSSLNITNEITIEACINLSGITGHKFQFIVGKKYRWALEICEKNYSLLVASDGYYNTMFKNPLYPKNFSEFFSILHNSYAIVILRKEMMERAFLLGPPYKRNVVYPEREFITSFFDKIINQQNLIYNSNTIRIMN